MIFSKKKKLKNIFTTSIDLIKKKKFALRVSYRKKFPPLAISPEKTSAIFTNKIPYCGIIKKSSCWERGGSNSISPLLMHMEGIGVICTWFYNEVSREKEEENRYGLWSTIPNIWKKHLYGNFWWVQNTWIIKDSLFCYPTKIYYSPLGESHGHSV